MLSPEPRLCILYIYISQQAEIINGALTLISTSLKEYGNIFSFERTVIFVVEFLITSLVSEILKDKERIDESSAILDIKKKLVIKN